MSSDIGRQPISHETVPDIGTKTIGGRAAVYVSLPLSVDFALVRYQRDVAARTGLVAQVVRAHA
jgi:hypothetical protein